MSSLTKTSCCALRPRVSALAKTPLTRSAAAPRSRQHAVSVVAFRDPFYSFTELERPLGNLLERTLAGQMMPAKAGPGQSMLMPHAFDVVELEDKFQLVADAPGMTPDEVKIELNKGVLSVSGSHEEAKYVDNAPKGDEGEEGKEGSKAGRRVIRSERRSYQFSRAFSLPETADPDTITAGLDKGVLTVSIAKRPEPARPEPKRIQVNASA
eukprot:gene1946-33357_t